VLKRWWIPAVLLLSIPWIGCKKSGGNETPNFFGDPPEVSEVSVTKERADSFNCSRFEDLCAAACLPNVDVSEIANIDLVTASARVVDPSPPDGNILVVVLRFLDPGAQITQVSLEMFDSGPIEVGTIPISDDSGNFTVPVHSGDAVANDGIFTRKFYFGTTTTDDAGNCIEKTDYQTLTYTYSTRTSSATIAPDAFLGFQFTVQGIDKKGNIATSDEIILPIQGTYRISQNNGNKCCPAPCPPTSTCTP